MRRKEFIKITPLASEQRGDEPRFGEKFLYDDYLPHSAVQEYAQKIIQKYKNRVSNYPEDRKQQVMILVDSLSRQNLKQLLLIRYGDNYDGGVSQHELLSDEDVEYHLKRLRKALLWEIGAELDPETFGLIVDELSLSHVKHFERPQNRNDAVIRADRGYSARQNMIACEKLADAKIKEPRIILPEAIGDENGGVMQTYKKNLKDFRSVLESEHNYSIEQLLDFLKQCLELIVYLKRNEIVMRDIKLENFEIDKKTGEVVIVDVEGFYTEGIEAEKIYTDEYEPPEFRENDGVMLKTRHTEMAYQIGVAVLYFVSFTRRILPERELAFIESIGEKLARDNPKDRLPLEDALKLIERIIEDIRSSSNSQNS